MKERYYIVSIEARPALSNPDAVFGVIVPLDEALSFYQVALNGVTKAYQYTMIELVAQLM